MSRPASGFECRQFGGVATQHLPYFPDDQAFYVCGVINGTRHVLMFPAHPDPRHHIPEKSKRLPLGLACPAIVHPCIFQSNNLKTTKKQKTT